MSWSRWKLPQSRAGNLSLRTKDADRPTSGISVPAPTSLRSLGRWFLEWYAKNAKRTLLERAIADLDERARNQPGTGAVLIGHKEKAGEKAILEHVNGILPAQLPSGGRRLRELAAAALALGQNWRRRCGRAGSTDLPTHCGEH